MTRRVLVIRPGAIGDTILTLPTIQNLTRKGYQGHVELMGSPAIIDWLVGRSAVASTSSFDRRDFTGLFAEQGALPTSASDYLSGFDLVLNYASSAGDAFSRNLRGRASQVLELYVQPAVLPREHISIYLQRPLAALGIQPSFDAPHIRLLSSDQRAASEWLQSRQAFGRRLIAVHPGSGSRHKNWPAERFAEVVRVWAGRPDTRVVLIRGPADGTAVAELTNATRGVDLLLVEQPALPVLAALLEHCQVYVGNDSGVSHLAAAMGTPSVVLFGPTDARIWAPQGPSVRVVDSSVDCSPCTAERRRQCRDQECLRSITVERVLAEMERVLLDPCGKQRAPLGSREE